MQISVGIGDFGKVRTKNLKFIDKTLFIKEVIDNIAIEVTLITRPRRFGKTFNLSTLHHFLAKEVDSLQTKDLFNDLKISNVDNGSYLQHQGKYPVIFISFKDIKAENFDQTYSDLYELIIKTFNMYNYLEHSEQVSKINKKLFSIIIGRNANKSQIKNSLKTLTACLFEHHGVKPWLLIDEYDTPIQSGYLNSYYNEITDLMRAMLGAALKDNSFLYRSVMTGILRVSKESLFSGLNNICVYSILDTDYSQHFGFTESEVNNLLQEAGLHNKEAEVKSWYNGYLFGGTTVYNPWSIVNYINRKGIAQAYWVNTSDDKLIRTLLSDSDDINIRKQFTALLKNEDVIQEIDENMVFGNLKTNTLAPWSLLLMAGYLNATKVVLNSRGRRICNCAIPNKEVQILYCEMIESWLSNNDDSGTWYRNFLSSLLNGDIETFTQDFGQVFSRIVSVHDTAHSPENFYHGFMLGLTASLEPQEYEVKSNKESGYGRYDLAIFPKDLTKYAVIFEFKSIVLPKTIKTTHPESLEATLEQGAQKALAQINQKQYITEAEHRGYKNIIKIGIAFNSKNFSLVSAGGNRVVYDDND